MNKIENYCKKIRAKSRIFQMFIQWLPQQNRLDVLKRRMQIYLVRNFTSENYETINYGEEDWDNLVILDACRFDLMEELNPFDTGVQAVHSNAPQTIDFLKKNFGGDHFDTVYVTASPQVARFSGDFAHLEHVWKDHWSDEHDTVLPENVTDKALEIENKYPDKRLVIHYMQPHFPFINSKIDQGSYKGELGGRELPSIWERLHAGEVSEEDVRNDYRRNLEIALPELERLVNGLKGKTVVTSDHGNLFGKKVSWLPFKVHGHPPGIKSAELTKVPWIELPFDERKNIVSGKEPGETEKNIDEEEIKEKLGELGYR